MPKKQVLLAVVVIIAFLTPFGCKAQEPKKLIPDELVEGLNHWFQTEGKFRSDNCKDMKVMCVRGEPLSRADQMNGVTEMMWVGITSVCYSSLYEKYYEPQNLALFQKNQNGKWSVKHSGYVEVDFNSCFGM